MQRDKISAPLAPNDKEKYESDVAALRLALGNEAFAAAREAGRGMTMEEACELTLS